MVSDDANFSVDWSLDGPGWAEIEVRAAGAQETITASYLSDPLTALAEAATLLLSGTTHATVSFEDEPGEYLLVLRVTDEGTVRLRILAFGLASLHPTATIETVDGRTAAVVLDVELETLEFAAGVLQSLRLVESDYGLEGYKEKWVRYPFPSAQKAQLEAAIIQASEKDVE